MRRRSCCCLLFELLSRPLHSDVVTVAGDVAHVLVLPGEPNMSTLSPASSVAVPHDPVGASVTNSSHSVVLYTHATPVAVDSTSVGRESTVESHTNSNWSTVQGRGQTVVSVNFSDTGDPVRKGVLFSQSSVAAVCIPVLEGVLGGGCQMVPASHSFECSVVEPSSGNGRTAGAVSGLLF